MILVGLNCEWSNCVGTHGEYKNYFECEDYRDAARCTLRNNYSNRYQGQNVLNGEFHDTETNITWSVDYKGHTQKDYRKETNDSFIERWTNEFWVDE